MPYFKPNQPEFNFLKHMILVGGNVDNPWNKDDFRHYVTHVNEHLQSDDWMFDTFAFWHFKSPKGGYLYSDVNIGTTMNGEGNFYAVPAPNPGTKQDWDAIIDWYFQPDTFADAFNQAVKEASLTLGKPEHKHNLVITIPYPGPLQSKFGSIDGKALNFSVQGQNLQKATEDRLAACIWFVNEVTRRFEEQNYEHLNLLGFYWTFETIHKSWDIDDHWLLKELYKHIDMKEKKFFWIPFFSSYNIHQLDNYQDYYFHAAFLQPNYMFYKAFTGVDEAAIAARERNAGIEMEFYTVLEEPIAVKDERLNRFDAYLNGGITQGYMKESAIAWFDGGRALYKIFHDSDERERQYYDKIYQFVKGTYSVK
ncbi:DUF4855 domain-containing protein [Fredinandcohnia humi]